MVVESIFCFARSRVVIRSRDDTALEILALRRQLTVLKRNHPRPKLERLDRIFSIALRRCWSRWTEALIIVNPETVVG